jgi:hypothetical protein
MITLDQLKEALAENGNTISDTTGQCIVDMVNAKEDCLKEHGLGTCEVMIAELFAAHIIGLNTGSRIVTSESVDVIRVSYKSESMGTIQKGLYNQLATMGAIDCFQDIVPPPVDSYYGFAFVGTGCS